jgi:hypothetical protein
MQMVEETVHRGHLIRCRQKGKIWEAQAFRDRSRDHRQDQKLVGGRHTAADRTAVVDAVRLMLDRQIDAERALRGADGFPTAVEVAEAYAACEWKLTEPQRRMLAAHVAAPEAIMSASDLAVAGGGRSFRFANSTYGKVGRMIAEAADWIPEERDRAGEPTWTFMLATAADPVEPGEPVDPEANGQWRWRLRPEMIAALAG